MSNFFTILQNFLIVYCYIFNALPFLDHFTNQKFFVLSVSADITIRSDNYSLPLGPYRCYVFCLAICLKNNQHFNNCTSTCQIYKNSEDLCSQNDARCWTTCKNMLNEGQTVLLNIPIWNKVNNTMNSDPSPWKANLEWSPVDTARLYILESREVDEKSGKVTNTEYQESTATSGTFYKHTLCSPYELRVLAVNEFAIGNFSYVATLEKPVPTVSDHNLTVNSIKLIDTLYTDLSGYEDNNTIEVLLKYQWPTGGWNMTRREFVPTIYSFQTQCPKCGGSMPSFQEPNAQYTSAVPLVRFLLPSVVMRCRCTYMFDFKSVESSCGAVEKFTPYDASLELFYQFNCESVNNSHCATAIRSKSAYCHVENFTSTYDRMNQSFNVRWSQIVDSTDGSRPSLYMYVIRSAPKRTKSDDLNSVDLLTMKLTGHLHFHTVSPDPQDDYVNVIAPYNVSADKEYYLQVCGLYGSQPQTYESMKWDIIVKHLLDSVAENNNATVMISPPYVINKGFADSTVFLIVFASVSACLCLICIFVWLYVKRRHRQMEKPKSIDQFRLEGDRIDDDESSSSRYVLAPRRFDHWELPRKRLVVYEDQKLGSGAFGAVYKESKDSFNVV